MISGVRADLASSSSATTSRRCRDKAGEIEKVLKAIAGNADVSVEQLTGLPHPADQGQAGRDRPPRRPGQGGARPGRVARRHAARRGRRGAVPLPAGRPPAGEISRHDPSKDDAKKLIEELPIVTATGERLPLSRLADASRSSRTARRRSRASGASGGSP